MGMIGRYIAALTPDGRDRLIRAQSWVSHRLRDGCGGGCLRGHGENVARWSYEEKPNGTVRADATEKAAWDFCRALGWGRLEHPASAFNLAFDRWGDRVVRAIKLRAARLNASDPATVSAMTAAMETAGV